MLGSAIPVGVKRSIKLGLDLFIRNAIGVGKDLREALSCSVSIEGYDSTLSCLGEVFDGAGSNSLSEISIVDSG